jgi:hypothetical protein
MSSENREEATVQDDVREEQIAQFCGLTRTGKRSGADALDEDQNTFELKSATKSGVSTGRDIGLHTIKVYRSEYWIVAEGKNYKTTSGTKKFEINSLYIAHPQDLESWFSKIEKRIKGDLEVCEAVLAGAQASGVDEKKIEFCRARLIRGVTLNNPKIPMDLVRHNATQIDANNSENAKQQIRQFVNKRPLKGAKVNPVTPDKPLKKNPSLFG